MGFAGGRQTYRRIPARHRVQAVVANPITQLGKDASDALRGKAFRRTTPMLWHHPTGRAKSTALAIRDGDWKLMMDPDGARLALYNLANDLSEKRNVAAENQDAVGRLKTRLLECNQSLPKQADGASIRKAGVAK